MAGARRSKKYVQKQVYYLYGFWQKQFYSVCLILLVEGDGRRRGAASPLVKGQSEKF
jgi:hypothetical protein